MRKLIVAVAMAMLLMSGCSTVPAFMKEDIQEFGKKVVDEAVDKAVDKGKELVEQKVKEVEAKVMEKINEKVASELDNFGDKLEEKEAHYNQMLAEDLGIKKEDFDFDKDGKLDKSERTALAKKIFQAGMEKKLPLTTIAMLILFAVLGQDARDWLKKNGKKLIKKTNGN